MNTKVLAIIVGLIIIVGGVWYFMSDDATDGLNETETAGVSDQSGQQAQGSIGKGSGTFASLIGRTGNYMCTFDSAVENSESSGTIYVGSGKMRGDFKANVEGERIETHMVRQGGYVYSWTSLSTQGFKMKDMAQADSGTPSGATQSQTIDESLSLTYDCSPWIVDARLLEIPTNITFTTPPGQ